MARLRPAKAYRRLKRAYTRKSKFRQKSYVKGVPSPRIVLFDVGDKTRTFPCTVNLISRKEIQIRENALESARLTANRYLELNLGKAGYGLKIRVIPHHILRENPLSTGAGSDRLQTGMSLSFGKPIGAAAQIHKGQTLFVVGVEEKDIPIALEAMRKATKKLPMHCSIETKKA